MSALVGASSSSPNPAPAVGRHLVVLLLVNGILGADLGEMLNDMKSNSKNIGTHKKREVYWQAYSKLHNCVSKMSEEKVYGFLTFHLESASDEEGIANYLEATKRQRGLLQNTDIMGKKLRPELSLNKEEWCHCFFDEVAQEAFDDITTGQPVVYLSQELDGVFIGTKLKRRKCRNAPSQALRTVAEVVAFKDALLPNSPLESISWTANEPVKINEYNFMLAGNFSKVIMDDKSVTHIRTSSTDDIYDLFKQKRNEYLITEAEKLIAQMQTDIAKGEANPICNTSVKLAGIARQNGLLKKVFVDATKKKFIDAVKADGGGVEMYVIENAPAVSAFMTFGGVVFELHYRADLDMFA